MFRSGASDNTEPCESDVNLKDVGGRSVCIILNKNTRDINIMTNSQIWIFPRRAGGCSRERHLISTCNRNQAEIILFLPGNITGVLLYEKLIIFHSWQLRCWPWLCSQHTSVSQLDNDINIQSCRLFSTSDPRMKFNPALSAVSQCNDVQWKWLTTEKRLPSFW